MLPVARRAVWGQLFPTSRKKNDLRGAGNSDGPGIRFRVAMAQVGAAYPCAGTVLNDQFEGDDAWEQYLAALGGRTPPIRALGITDYYSLDTYERVRAEKVKGRLPG